MEKVLVLLAAYNGMPWIEEQIDSILNQQEVEVSLLIRDDGSTDDTCSFISQKYGHLSNVTLIKGENLGFIKNFFTLTKIADESSYYAFSDQDDVWDSNKLITAINLLKPHKNKPAMCHSKPVFLDENENVLPKKITDKSNIWAKPSSNLNAITRSCAIGCAIVFNKKARDLFCRPDGADTEPVAGELFMSLICYYFGAIEFSDKPLFTHIARPGSNSSRQARLKSRLHFLSALVKPSGTIYLPHHSYLLRYYKDVLTSEQIRDLEIVENYKENLKYKISLLFNKEFVAKRLRDTLFIKMLVLISKY